jgi:hypothetical protein
MPVPDPETVVDHFKIWETAKRDSDWTSFLRLLDQFLRREERRLEGRPSQIEWIANPVEKNGKSNLHEELHLTGWKMRFQGDNKAPTGRVSIKDQFHKRDWVEWNLGKPQYLLVPAGKNIGSEKPDDPGAKKIDHYLCYEVTKAKTVTKDITLKDQFDIKFDRIEEITKLEPKFLGVPVRKGGSEKLVHEDVHLTIYALTPQFTIPADDFKITTNDQFRVCTDLGVIKSLYLAVPALKKWQKEKD